MSHVRKNLLAVLTAHVGRIVANSVVSFGLSSTRVDLEHLGSEDTEKLISNITLGLRLYLPDPIERENCLRELKRILSNAPPTTQQQVPTTRTERIPIESEQDVIAARSVARALCQAQGAIRPSQVKIVTVVSELARNIVQYAGKGAIELAVVHVGGAPALAIAAIDHGPGIANVDEILSGSYVSKTGLGLGLAGTKRIVNRFEISSSPAMGTTVRVQMVLELGDETGAAQLIGR